MTCNLRNTMSLRHPVVMLWVSIAATLSIAFSQYRFACLCISVRQHCVVILWISIVATLGIAVSQYCCETVLLCVSTAATLSIALRVCDVTPYCFACPCISVSQHCVVILWVSIATALSIATSQYCFACLWSDSLAWLIHMCDVTYSYVWHDSFTWWHVSFIRVTWLVHTNELTHLHMWHDSFICVTWFIFHVWCDSITCVT